MNSLNKNQKDNFYFQAHVTLEKLDNVEDYITLCEKYNVKPVLIKLAKGNFVNQPMYTQHVVAKSLEEALFEVEKVKNIFTENGLHIVRTKIEINAESVVEYFQIDADKWGDTQYRKSCMDKIKDSYFEVHIKVKYNNIALLQEIAIKNNLYLSQNDREPNIRFLSVRKNLIDALNIDDKTSFDIKKFYLHDKNLSRAFENDLKAANMEIVKEKYECCIYDTNKNLDLNWGFNER